MTNKIFTYGSVCSGIEAVSAAWHSLLLTPLWFSEIDPFPSAVLKQRWPRVPNLGDMTTLAQRIMDEEIRAPDILVGGTPCQSFSIAGLRHGLADSRGQLTIAFVELADAIDKKRSERGESPCLIIWENVPGVLSSKDNAFGCFTGALAGESCALQPTGKRWTNAGCIYGPTRTVAFRLLDAQFFGLAQRRKRVFVVASARNDINPAEILFEWESVRRHSPPGREKGKETAGNAGAGIANCSHWDGAEHPHPTLTQSFNTGGIGQSGQELFSQRGAGIVMGSTGIDEENNASDELFGTLKAHGSCGFQGAVISRSVNGDITHALTAAGRGGSEDGTGRGTPVISTFRMQAFGEYSGDNTAYTCKARDGRGATDLAVISASHSAENTDSTGGNRNGNAPEHGVHTETPPCGQASAFKAGQGAKARGIGFAEEQSPTLTNASSGSCLAPAVLLQAAEAHPGMAFAQNTRDEVRYEGHDGQISGAVCAMPGARQTTHWCGGDLAVRRLLPVECERLQGFPAAGLVCTVTVMPPEETVSSQTVVPVLMHIHVDAELSILRLERSSSYSVPGGSHNETACQQLPAASGDMIRLITLMLTEMERVMYDRSEMIKPVFSFRLQRGDGHYAVWLSGGTHEAGMPCERDLAFRVKNMLQATSRRQKRARPGVPDLPLLFRMVAEMAEVLLADERQDGLAWAFTLDMRRGYTQIPWRGKCALDCPDGPRYKALGNAMAVPVIHWLGKRIYRVFCSLD